MNKHGTAKMVQLLSRLRIVCRSIISDTTCLLLRNLPSRPGISYTMNADKKEEIRQRGQAAKHVAHDEVQSAETWDETKTSAMDSLPSLVEIKRTISSECFRPVLIKSFAYAVRPFVRFARTSTHNTRRPQPTDNLLGI